MATVIKIDSKDLIYVLDKSSGNIYYSYTSNIKNEWRHGHCCSNKLIITFCADSHDRYLFFINENKYMSGWNIFYTNKYQVNEIPDYIKKYMTLL